MAKKEVACGARSFALSYEIVDNGAEIWALFLHGWGSSKEALSGAFGGLFRGYNHLYLDLPGFGNSTNDFVLDSGDYAGVVRAFLEALNIAPVLVVGHSFGGKIATLLNPQILVLLSSAGLPKPKSLRIRAKILAAKVLKFCGVKTAIFRTKDAQKLPQNMYETLKRVVDEDLSAEFRARGRENAPKDSRPANLASKNLAVANPSSANPAQNQAANLGSNPALNPNANLAPNPPANPNPPLQTFIFWGEDDCVLPLFLGKKIHCIIHGSSLHCLAGDHFFYLKNATEIDRIVNAN